VLSSAIRHEVSFWHGPQRLSGELRLPQASGPRPILVVVREPQQRQRDYAPWLDVLATAGIASLTWDRPQPVPDGTGSRRRVAHHAREVLSAVDWLRCRPDLDAAAIALLGWGEGGWAAAQAATYSQRIAALVLVCTPLAPPVAPPMDGAHDARPTISAVTVPVLALFGEQDPIVPLEGSIRGVRSALAEACHPDHEVVVVRGADHGLRVRAPHGLGPIVDGLHRFGDWPPGLTRLLVEWLDRRLRPRDVPSFPPPAQSAPRVPSPAHPAGRPAGHSVGHSVGRAVERQVGITGVPAPVPVPVRQVRRRVAR
jgi:dienelactone hydrolase